MRKKKKPRDFLSMIRLKKGAGPVSLRTPHFTLKIFGAEEDFSLEIEYSQSGTYRPYKREKYATVRTKTTAHWY